MMNVKIDNELTCSETKRLLWLVRKEERDEKPWPMFHQKSQLKNIEAKLLIWLNNGAR